MMPVLFATGDAAFADDPTTDMIALLVPSGDATIRVMLTLHQLSKLAHRAQKQVVQTQTHNRPVADVIPYPRKAKRKQRS